VPEPVYGRDEARPEIWVYLERKNGQLEGISRELLAKGRELADQAGWCLAGLLPGQGRAPAEEAIAHGADRIYWLDHPWLDRFDAGLCTAAVEHVILEHRPCVLLCGATPDGRDLAGRLAVRLRTGLNADCTNLSLDAERGALISEVTGFGGGVIALLEIPEARPQISTVRPGVFRPGLPAEDRQGEVVRVYVELEESQRCVEVLEEHLGESVDLTQAEVLLCGGRGVEGDFGMLRELADLLGGEIGATRPPVDEGFIERERQVGQTGVVCRPKVAIACGISGAFHFIVGIQEAGTILAINSDPQAPIFEYADYGAVGDAHQIIRALIRELKQEREGAHA